MKRLFDESMMANSGKMLIFLSHDRNNQHQHISQRVFECKTCNRQFPSFQALGGHRASHKKPRLEGPDGNPIKPKLHECSICGLEFSIGQALGGHMRRHKSLTVVANSIVVKKDEEKKTNFRQFDLNQPAEELERVECRNAIAVDCFQ